MLGIGGIAAEEFIGLFLVILRGEGSEGRETASRRGIFDHAGPEVRIPIQSFLEPVPKSMGFPEN